MMAKKMEEKKEKDEEKEKEGMKVKGNYCLQEDLKEARSEKLREEL